MSKDVNVGKEKAVGKKKSGDSKPLVSIMLLNMNGKKLTKDCIDSVLRNTSYPNYEIVVVDNGSIDGSVEMLKEMQKKGVVKKLILNPKNAGYSAGVNQGFGACNGKYVYHLDNDTLVEKGWLEKAVEAAEGLSGKAGAVGSALVSKADYGKGLQGKEVVRERPAVCGAAMMYSREALEKVGLLDAELWSPIYGEEQDWCYRARNAGFKVLETNASRVFHIGGQDTMKSIKAIARYELLETNRIKAMLYNLSVPDMASHVPGLGLIFVNSLKSGMAPNLLKCYWNNLANWQEVLKQRQKRKARLF
ncbi:MAG: glycosyltransferase family 2 protein [archaeon]